ASAISQFDFAVAGRLIDLVAVVVVVVKRNVGVITLNQTSARRVVLGGGQRKAGVFGQRINCLHQTFTESSFADDQATIMVLNGTGNNLSRGCGPTIHQHNQRTFFAAVAARGHVALLG